MEDVAILYVGVPYIKISNKLQCTSAIVYLMYISKLCLPKCIKTLQ